MEEQESIDGIIYCYTNPVNGKKYVGQTTAKGWNRRHRQHRTSDKKYPLYYAFNKYGYDSFVLQILIDGVPTRSKLSELEIYYIELLDSYNSGYNQTTGGEGMRNYKMPSEVSEKISKANKGRKHSIDSRLLMSLRKKETAMRGSSHVNASRVQCVETGIIYPTLIEASKSVGGRSNSSIAAFLHGRAKTAHGYTWTTAIQDKPIAECPPCKPKKASEDFFWI